MSGGLSLGSILKKRGLTLIGWQYTLIWCPIAHGTQKYLSKIRQLLSSCYLMALKPICASWTEGRDGNDISI